MSHKSNQETDQEVNRKTDNESFTPLPDHPENRCFACGILNHSGMILKFQVSPQGSVRCDATIPEIYDSHPGVLHGGIVALLLDETMGKASFVSRGTSMTRQLQVEYLLPVPSSTPLRIQARVTRAEGRKCWLNAEIKNQQGQILAQATGFFLSIKRQAMQNE